MSDREGGFGSHDGRKTKKIVLIMVLAIAVIVLIGSISGYLYIKSALQPVQPGSNKRVTVEIPRGSSAASIGSILEGKGVIKDARVFRFYTKAKKETGFKAGEYVFTPAMTLNEITTSLKRGYSVAGPAYRVTVPEGMTVDEIADIFAKRMQFTKEDFLTKANDPEFIATLMDKYPNLLKKDILNKKLRTPLEGYLFAATYDFNRVSTTPEMVIERLVKTSDKEFGPYQDEIKKSGMSLHQIATMASVVEKETGTSGERKEIAGVFYNRIKEGMPLQTDPTVLYALGKHKEKVYFKDLEVKSPYNTYKVKGLPVGPISNFGKSALEAAIEPAKTDYLYFLHDEEGKVHFAKDFDEHLKLKQQYIK
ncbi:endolytic transglycosylase MltG [Aciduricibacillus chroicocephali]|uniref:Endolytic murein transglycosylase n=1 Tax=Aciduricibacillus chroicocephali TaxID=3054939 RepID=A0ABY9KSW1_9BACI|nr:endolytic transglycosylase MltG [Bacillaceae bacterium 44XB]